MKQNFTKQLAGLLLMAAPFFGTAQHIQGPSSSQTPFLKDTMSSGVVFKSIISANDAAPNGYKFAGIPDGVGAFDNGNGTFTVLINHEIGNTLGAVRAHGAKGAFAFGRFCSADLPEVTAFYNSNSGNGTQNRIFMNGEETGAEGKAVAHIVTGAAAGVSYELPYLGKFAWENAVALPLKNTDKTVVAGMDDGTGGQVYFYIGTKTNTGLDIEKAGLTNGK
ncbi:MAG: hypothetical protein NTZ59_12385, partial [Bacteroidetes bacterium]|nr:hypothetical protein [Bacteroidota bacterium]